ncbi:MAG TPA: glycoside hydrolase family 16 protein [Mycobacteriales bacterium]|jgi:beta-glucanase (GH16 family)|nr:glycoside hydrolase family 16 protein [Mycobacteriales bacterium]
MRHRRAAAGIGIAAILSGSMLATSIGASAAAPHAATTCNALQQALGLCKATPTPTPTPSSPSPTPTATQTSTEPDGDCGGVPITKPDGSTWTCSFDDEFDGTSLDRSQWAPQLTANSNFTTGKAPYKVCYVDNPNTVSVSGGDLRLSVVKTAAKFTCTAPSTGGLALHNFSTQYQGGEVTTYYGFHQTYGRFEVRAKLPQSTVSGLQETFWLWPTNDTKYGGGEPASGEIDFAEFYSQYGNQVIPYLHYDYNKATVNTTTNTNIVTNDYTCIIDPTQFNDYAVDWEPGRITLTYNGNVCLVDNYKPSDVTSPAPFDQPFFLALTQALGVGTNAPTASTPIPATTLVDYVRVWK